jgi:hypothetical protein
LAREEWSIDQSEKESSMTVYLLWWDDGMDSVYMFGVFSSKDKAQEKINTLTGWHLPFFSVEERKIDE